MEVTLFTSLPHVTEPEKLEPIQNNAFILDSNPVIKPAKISEKENKLGASTSLESVKSELVQDENVFQCSPKKCCDNLIYTNKNFDTKMRVEAEDVVLDSVPVASEVVSLVNGSVPKEISPCVSPFDTCSASDISSSANKINFSSTEASIDDSNASSTDSPKKKRRYLFNFRPSLGKILVKTKNGDSFKCYTCGGIYRQKFSLKRHFLRTHIDYRYISEADIANCKIPVPSYVTQHSNLENSSNGRKKFKRSNDDVFLENNDTGLLPGLYRCHDCTNVSFDSDAELREHYNKHPDSIKKKYECSICQASFIKKQILSRHLAGHEGKKIKLLCKKCNMEFSSKDELDKHLSTHASGKTCRICEKVLSNVANRKRHERLHLNSGKRCPHCDQCFAQRKELGLHIKSQHGELSRTCNVCNQLCLSAESLTQHIEEKHKNSPDLPNATENITTENTTPSDPLPKPKPTRICFVCKRLFPTVYAMLKHRRNAHPFHSRRKRHRKTAKAKSAFSNSEPGFNEYKKTYVRPVGRPKGSGKKIATGEMRFLDKRDRFFIRRTRKEDVEFYGKVYENIAYNLTHCIDGKASQLSLKEYNFNDMQQLSEDFEERVHFPWQFYNFPSWYDVSNVLKVKGCEIKRPENLSVADEFLQNAAGLTPVNLSTSPSKQVKQSVESTNDVSSSNKCISSKEFDSEEKKKLLGKDIISVLVCHVCKEGLDSYEAFTEHCINNHPNVECSYVEIIGDKNSPPIIPPEMCKTVVSPVGFRFAYDVPPAIHKGLITCTKCRKIFRTTSELHEHMVSCGNLVTSKAKVSFKIPVPPEHSMRKRMTMAQYRSGFNNRSGQTPEKRQSFMNKSSKSISGKTPRPEKLLFYKKDRLQTKSFTVDKNYFTTKPKPIKSGMSKRGRKSYEEKSLAYRYASMQASTSRECPRCRTVFASIQLLNNHVKFCKLLIKNKDITASNSAGEYLSKIDHIVNNATGKDIKSEFRKQSAVSNLTKLFNYQASSKEFSYKSHETSQKKSFSKKSSDIPESSNVPIDLSSTSSDNKAPCSSAKISNQPNTSTTKSALEVAIEAVQKHLTEFSNDEPIYKLQQIADKFTSNKSSPKSPNVSPVQKSGSGKKVGRPRKIKKETSTPIPMKKEAPCDSPDKKSSPKPKKLEEIVKGIKESKVRVDECQSPMKESSEQTSVPGNKSAIFSSPVSKQNQSDLQKSRQKFNNVIDRNIGNEKSIQQNVSQNLSHKKPNYSTDLNNKFSVKSDVGKMPSKVIELPAEKREIHNVCNDTNLKPNDETSSADVEIQKIPREIKVITLTSSNSDIKVSEKPDTSTQDASAHGRSSPTSEFECLLKSINQRLLSEDKNHQDDSAIPWLEDEKFEIPPSRNSLSVIVTPNAENISVKAGNFTITKIVSTSKDKVNEQQDSLSADKQVLPGITKELPIKTIIINTEEQNKATFADNNVSQQMKQVTEEKMKKETLSKSVVEDALVSKSTDKEHNNKAVCTGEKAFSSHNNKTQNAPKTTKNEIKPLNQKSSLETVKSSITSPEKKIAPKTAKTEVNSAEKRRPGRPRKKPIEADVESSNITKTFIFPGNAKLSDSQTMRSKASKPSAISRRNSTSDVGRSNKIKKSSPFLFEPVPLTMGASNSTQSSGHNIEGDKSKNQTSNDSGSSEPLKSSSKTVIDNECDNLKTTTSKSTTTEFGKNLASKMKEKMRLSLEQDLPRTTVSSEDANNSNCGSENSETNLLLGTEEKLLKIIKKEYEPAENNTNHACPYCCLEFAYLTNFRRHVKQCKARDQAKESEPVSGTQTTNLLYLPKKDEVDYCMLNLYRFQSRQTDMLKEEENANKHIKTYECNVCHKIYLNLFNLIQHKLSSHKLNEQNNPVSSSEMNEMNILSLAGHLNPLSSRSENDSSIVDGNVDVNALTNILEDYQKPSNSKESGENLHETGFSKPENGKDQSVETVFEEFSKSEKIDLKIVKREYPDDDDDFVKSGVKNKSNHSIGLKEKDKKDSSLVSPNITNLNRTSGNESSPIKRKRGRPFGWRKNPNAAQENLAKSNKIKADKLKKSLLKLKKKSEMHHSKAKFKTATKKIILDKVKKAIAKKKTKNISNEDTSTAEPSVKNTSDKKVAPVDKVSVSEKIIKSAPKQLPVKSITESKNVPDSSKDASETNSTKNPIKLLDKSQIKTEPGVDGKENIVKRGRGRPPWKNIVRLNKSTSKSEDPPKRRPGRPPKCSMSSTNSTQSAKFGIASSSSAKNPKRASMPMPPLNIDSSDSDSNDTKNDPPVKKKINLKCCALCSDKFVSSLELKRHIQLKHNRKHPDDSKSELQRKILKGYDSRSSSTDTPECEKDVSVKRCESPQRKPSQTTPSRKSDPGKSNVRSPQFKKPEPNPVKKPEPNPVKKPDLKTSQPNTSSSSPPKSSSTDVAEDDKDVSPKRGDVPQKHHKICAICKQKFLTGPLLHQHLQMFHNRKSPVSIIPIPTPAPVRKSLPPAAPKSSPFTSLNKKKKELSFKRNSLSRQCRRPLPPLKRPRIMKKEPLEQIVKKPKS